MTLFDSFNGELLDQLVGTAEEFYAKHGYSRDEYWARIVQARKEREAVMKIAPVRKLREVFPNEAKNLSPWVAANLDRVGTAAGMAPGALQLVRTEHPLKRRNRIDVLARIKIGARDRRVVVENQLEPSDHDHLGRLLTYSIEVEAYAAIWIAPSFTDEHLDALDELTRRMNCQFKAVRIEARALDDGDYRKDLIPARGEAY
ncbi:hypothetical protein ABZY44_32460 [Streptomyces sp. NPDC006544]|uniref:hypothetical protein n=1 Tax=Streptomyces sp. NPDC006544 TaxID=3154583 RepID=UPI0033B095CA